MPFDGPELPLPACVRHAVSAAVASLLIHVPAATAATFTWVGAPNGAWDDTSNWSPAQLPGSADDVDLSRPPGSQITPVVTGTTVVQARSVALVDSSALLFFDSSSAGSAIYNAQGAGTAVLNNGLQFQGSSTAANAVINVTGSSAPGTGFLNSTTIFTDNASAGNAAITVSSEASAVFSDNAGAASASITNNNRGVTFFQDSATAASATITNNSGGVTFFGDSATAGSATITNQAGGSTFLIGGPDASSATVVNNAGGVVDLSQATTGISIGSLGGAGNVYIGGKTLTLGALNRNDAISGAISDSVSPNYTAFANELGQTIDTGSGGSLVKVGSGTLTLSGSNSYSGATRVDAGTLRAGAANTLSAASAHAVAAGATLDLAGFSQTIASLSNAGTVSLIGAAPGATLTVNGPFVGQGGLLRMSTALGADGSPSDRLVLNGPSAVASGSTQVQLVNVGGLGALTTGNGIELISATGGATTTAQTTKDAFSLVGGHVDAGAFEYTLQPGDASGAGESWYLRSTTTTTTQPGGAPVPSYRAEVPLVAALPAQLRQAGLAMLGNMHQRIGDADPSATSAGGSSAGGDRRAWGRILSTDIDIRQSGTVSPSSDGRLSGFQGGTDLWADARWRAGVYVGQLDGDVDVNGFVRGTEGLRTGSNDLRSQYLGVYGTYAGETGFYADAVLQAARHRYTIQPLSAAQVSGKGSGTWASLEVGQGFGIGGRWIIEPQLQLVYQHLSLDDIDIAGARVQNDADSGWMVRAGVRAKGLVATPAGALQPYARFNVYHASSGTDVARFIGPAGQADIATRIGHTSTELAAGATLQLSAAVSLYGEVGKLFAAGGDDERVESGAQGSMGLRLRW